ncbi:MAG: hypothetical protein PHT57_06810 [Rhodoferax sp.]|nr:hypothetical protein [Rhodoferax sp.]
MHIIRDHKAAATLQDLELRACIEKTFSDLSEQGLFDSEEWGYFLIMEPADSQEAISLQLGFSLLHNRWSGACFGHAGFTPSWEVMNAHEHWYELVFVISDDGFGVVVFIPKRNGIDPHLLAMCARYAVPAQKGSKA